MEDAGPRRPRSSIRVIPATTVPGEAGVGLGLAWLSVVREDVSLLVGEFLPEALLVTVLALLLWAIRRLSRDLRSIG
jgi:hypothetical protein